MPQIDSSRMSNLEIHRLNRVLGMLAVGWTLLIITSFASNWNERYKHAEALACEEARSRFETDMAYRRWVIMLGGIYVPVTPQTPPNPYLAHVPDRDITTPSGQPLTLVNSSYMTRQVADHSGANGGPRGHITSLKPLRPENAADPWEARALKAFDGGADVVHSIELQEGQPYLRYMRPMITDANCMKCHAAQGYREGDVRGGISETIPMQPYLALMRSDMTRVGLIHLLLWGLGALALTQGGRHIRRGIRDREKADADRAALREQLHQSQKMEAIGQLAGGVAHDFNNLLTVILVNLDMAEARLPDSTPVRESAATIRNAAEQAVGLTRSLLMFSRKLPAEKKTVKLQDIVSTATRMLRRLLPASIEVVTDIKPEPTLWLLGDATQLQQVILNLAINARDAMPGGGKLGIRVWADKKKGGPTGSLTPAYACVAVSDTGIGIPDDVRSRLFEPFFSTKPRGQGTGLGLPIVQGIVEAHLGRIEIESVVGRGSTFTVYLPCAAPQEAIVPAKGSADVPRGHGEAILLVEDNEFVRDSIATMLGGLGYRVFAAADGLAATALWRGQREQIRLLIFDMDLPGQTGVECLRAFRSAGAATPAIVISGRPDWDQTELNAAQATLLRKPFKADELAGLIQQLLTSAAVR